MVLLVIDTSPPPRLWQLMVTNSRCVLHSCINVVQLKQVVLFLITNHFKGEMATDDSSLTHAG